MKSVPVFRQQAGVPKSRHPLMSRVTTPLPNTRASKMNDAYASPDTRRFLSVRRSRGTWVFLGSGLVRGRGGSSIVHPN